MRALVAFAGATTRPTVPRTWGSAFAFFARLHTVLPMLSLLMGLFLSSFAPARADTSVSGNIESNTRWTLASSPYVIQDNLYVVGGATLQIDPGVQVYVNAGARLTVVSGSLLAQGTAAQPIVFSSAKVRQGQGAAGDWGPWTFTAGTVSGRLEHVRLQHGKGMVLESASPTLNHVEWLNHRGPAIAMDLKSSPVGVGLKASGCDVNGISVPPGDMTTAVRWGLRGMPYVLAGQLSVGQSPLLNAVSPASVERGQTVTLTVSGVRLGGLGSASLDKPGLSLTPFTGGSSSQLFLQLTVAPDAPLGPAKLRLRVDAGELELANAVTVTRPMPAITSISPTSVLAGAGLVTLSVQGRNFAQGAEVLINGAALPTTLISASELQAPLPNQTAVGSLQVQVRMPDGGTTGQFLMSGTTSLAVQAPVPPLLSIEPTPVALPPDGKPRELTLRLSKADYRDNTILLSVSDTSKASVMPPSVVIPAGQTSAKFTVTPGTNSATLSLIADSATLAKVTVPVFLTQDFRGANTAYAMPVGVVVESVQVPRVREVQLNNLPVGVSVGAALSGATPRAWARGGVQVLTIRGNGLTAGTQVSLEPSAGLSLADVTVSPDGQRLQVSVSSAGDLAAGPRRVIVKDAQGRLLSFADPESGVVQITNGLPIVESIEPISVLRGTTVQLIVRGQHLQQGRIVLAPEAGLSVDAEPTISADGRTLSARLSVDSGAATGEHVVRVETPAGVSSGVASPANTLMVGARLNPAVTPVVSPVVGVVVGQSTPTREPVQRALDGGLVGVLRGTGVSSVSPRVGVIGSEVAVQVQGMGLDGVASIRFVPEAGLTLVSGPTAAADGRTMTFVVQVAPTASLGLRRLVLRDATGMPVTYARPDDGAFLVSAPLPELDSVSPAIVVSGAADVRMTVRGRNLQNASDVRIEPASGMRVAGPYVVSEDGRELSFTLGAEAGATSGVRTVVVTTPAGTSSTEVTAANMVRIASQLGATYPAISSPLVGVVVQSAAEPQRVQTDLVSRAITVVVGSPTPAPQPPTTAFSLPVGVTRGPVVNAVAPRGFLQGASGSVVVEGRGLGAVTGVSIRPATGILLGEYTVSADQTRLTVPVSVSPDAALGGRELRLATVDGPIVFADAQTDRSIGIGRLPVLTSVSPIIVEQGKEIVLTVRGSHLAGVQGVQFSPDTGLRATEVTASSDALGEKLTVRVQADAGAPLGDRAVILTVPGGQTTSTLSPANTLKVVPPQ